MQHVMNIGYTRASRYFPNWFKFKLVTVLVCKCARAINVIDSSKPHVEVVSDLFQTRFKIKCSASVTRLIQMFTLQ